MSHTTRVGDTFSFIHDGDYQGKIEIVNRKTSERLEIASEALFEFMGSYLMYKRQCELDSMTGVKYLDRLVKNGG